MGIFSDNAQKYWDLGIPVMPLRPKEKIPVFRSWQFLSNRMPTPEEQESWLASNPNGNIGLPLGQQAGIVIVDIDAEDPAVEAAIRAVLPKSPWERVGKKGAAVAFRYNGERSTRIRGAGGVMLVEILSTGTQVVLPPSIHPDTQRPYVANAELTEVYDQLPMLPKNIVELLRSRLASVTALSDGTDGGKFRMSDYVSTGSRDVQLTRMCGKMSLFVLTGECTVIEGMNSVISYAETQLAKTSNGDDIPVEKAQEKFLEFLRNDVRVKNKLLPPGWDEGLTPEQKSKWGLEFDSDNEEWSAQELNDYIYNQLQGQTDTGKRMEVTKKVLKKLATAKQLSELDQGQILSSLRKNNGLNLPISYYNKELKALTAGPLEGNNHTEIAVELIKVFEERHGKLAYWAESFWTWEGDHWEKMEAAQVMKKVAVDFGALPAAKRASDHKGILEVMRNLLPQKLSEETAEGVNFQNGFLTKDLNLIPHQPEQGMTYILPYPYDPSKSNSCTMFQQYLYESWGHHIDYEEKKQALQEAIAVTVFGAATAFQRAFIMIGVGGTGKSVILDVISAMVPKEAQCALAPQKWAERFVPAEFSGKLLNCAGELSENARINGQHFKEIVSGERMTAEFKNNPLFTFQPKAAHWFSSNHLPKTIDTSNGFNRRWLFFTFDVIVPPEKKQLELGKLIAAEEADAIIAWALEAWPNLIARQGFTLPVSHEAKSHDMALHNSLVRSWLAERVIFTNNEKDIVQFNSLWQDYWAFAAMSLSKRATPIAFEGELQQVLTEEKKLNMMAGPSGRMYVGLALKEKKK